MPKQNPRARYLWPALKLAGAYLIVAGCWILVSDIVVESISPDGHLQRILQTYKGWLFVAVTATLLYGLVRRHYRKRHATEERFTRVFESAPGGMALLNCDGEVLQANAALARMLHSDREKLEGERIGDFVVASDRDAFENDLQEVCQGRAGYLKSEERYRSLAGELMWGLRTLSPVHESGDRVSPLVLQVQDITPRKEAERRAERHIERLRTLRSIDLAITGTVDMSMMLDVFLRELTTSLGIDAATVLLTSRESTLLRHGADTGFMASPKTGTEVALDEGPAGRAIRSDEIQRLTDLSEAPEERRILSSRLPVEQYVSYFAVPLVSKGHPRGVLEILQEQRLDPDAEWLDFLDALATQAAIGIDAVGMVEDLRKSRDDLRMAYEETIEGWARALDLRDEETEGHTRRVTRVTVLMAREMGMPEKQIVHARRGALLHDIGKMGIPDNILLKRDRLTDEEKKVMRQHPVYAYKLLSPIEYLEPALDIPYCHHEKWDGTGYPRGLEAREIPFAARIFAVVDVWDALRSDRPYREAWTDAQVREYLERQKGKYFDPHVAGTFLEMDWQTLDEEGDAAAGLTAS